MREELKMSRDIIIHYDEADGKIVCSTVEHTLTAPLLEKALPLETSIDALKAKGADEAERSLGAGILALLELSSHTKIGIRDYSTVTAEWEAKYTDELEQKSASGDVAAQYELAMQLIAEGLNTKSRKKMNEADVLLRQVVASGHVEAAEYLADLWPVLKDRADRSFK
jgi:hypothetical protein